jgi:hypothetical protein
MKTILDRRQWLQAAALTGQMQRLVVSGAGTLRTGEATDE